MAKYKINKKFPKEAQGENELPRRRAAGYLQGIVAPQAVGN